MVNLGGRWQREVVTFSFLRFGIINLFSRYLWNQKKTVKSYKLLIGNNYRPVWQRPQAAPCIYSLPISKEQNLQILSYI